MAETSDKPDSTPENRRPRAATADGRSLGSERRQPFEIAVLALQNTTLFPDTVVPLAVGRPRSVAAVEAALATEEKLLACITVRADVNTAAQDATPATFTKSARSR